MAAQIYVFKVIGNSNIQNAFSTHLKLAEKISGQVTEFVPAEAYSSGITALGDIGGATTVLVNFLLNGLVDVTELCTDLDEVDNVLQGKVNEYAAAIRMATVINPDTKFFVIPPMLRTTPFWLETKLMAVATALVAPMQGIANLTMLSPFNVSAKVDLEADGVHLHRKAQSRLFSFIMQSLFPNSVTTKNKNNRRDRNDMDDEVDSPPPKKVDERVLSDSPQPESVIGNALRAATPPTINTVDDEPSEVV